MEKEGVPFTIILSEPLAKFLLLVLMTLCPANLEVLAPEGRWLPPEDNNDSSELEVKIATWPFQAPHASESTGKKGSYGVV